MSISTREDADSQEDRRRFAERLEARLNREQKELLQRAADIEGRTLTDFVVNHATVAAKRTIEEHTIIKLSQKASLAFVESLLNPPEPSPKMLAAAQSYKRSMGLG